MKKLLPVIILIALIGCKKTENIKHFEIVASVMDKSGGQLKIENRLCDFTDSFFKTDVYLGPDDVFSLELYCLTRGYVTIDLNDGNSSVGQAYGRGTVYMVITNDGMTYATKESYLSTSNGTSGSGCSTVQCTATTQSGSRCKRMTTNCNGRCWQH